MAENELTIEALEAAVEQAKESEWLLDDENMRKAAYDAHYDYPYEEFELDQFDLERATAIAQAQLKKVVERLEDSGACLKCGTVVYMSVRDWQSLRKEAGLVL